MKKQALAMLLGTALVLEHLQAAEAVRSRRSSQLQRTRQRVKIHRIAQKTDESKEGEEKGQLMMATTTSTADTGFWTIWRLFSRRIPAMSFCGMRLAPGKL